MEKNESTAGVHRIPVLNIDVVSREQLGKTLANASYWSLDVDCTKGACGGEACPVNYGNEATEMSQNYGCLPSPRDIIEMRALHGLTWACHDDTSKPCVSGVRLLKALKLPFKIHQLESIF